MAISKKQSTSLLHLARWDDAEAADAVAMAQAVAAQIRQGVFWPPSEKLLDDEFAALAMEGVWGRQAALQAGGDHEQ